MSFLGAQNSIALGVQGLIHIDTGGGAGGSADYLLAKSLRFRSSASAYLNRTPTATGSRTTFTWSGWVKRGALGTGSGNRRAIFSSGRTDGSPQNGLVFRFFDDQINASSGGGVSLSLTSTAVYRDPAAWYHLVFAVDTTQGTASNRVKIYVNGAQVTSFGTATYPSASQSFDINTSSYNAYNGAENDTGTLVYYFDGEMAEVNFVDGQALLPTAFGASSIYNQWLPIRYAGTYGTNGFYLPFNSVSTSSYAGSFNGSSQYLSVAKNAAFEPSAAQPWTVEAWVYITSFTNANEIFAYTNAAVTVGADIGTYMFVNATTGTITGGMYNGVNQYVVTSSAGLPLNAWVHCALVSSGSAITIYVNGLSVGSTSTSLAPNVPVSATLKIGYFDSISLRYMTGQISNFRFVKGTAVYTANFIPPTAALTAITNTSLLTLQNATIVDNSTNAFTITNTGTVVTSVQSPFLNTTVLTADSSGNANNWTPNNISLTAGSTYDSLTDVPTLTSTTVANYAVLNPLWKGSQQTISNGNLTSSKAVGTTISDLWGNFGMTSGKWYFECSVTALAGTLYIGVGQGGGIGEPLDDLAVSPTSYFYTSFNGDKNYGGTSAAYGNSYTVGDVIGCAVDMTNGKIWWSKNGTWQASGDPAAGTNAAYTDLLTRGSNAFLVYSAQNAVNNSNTLNWNFGQQPFVYPTLPSGFLPLNTYNI